MGRGTSKVGSGGGGRSVSSRSIDAAIANAMNGGIPVSFEEVADIMDSNYGLNAGKLSEKDRVKLAGLFPKKEKEIISGKVVNVSLDNLSTLERVSLARLAKKIGTYASTFCMEDALKLVSYWQNNGIPF